MILNSFQQFIDNVLNTILLVAPGALQHHIARPKCQRDLPDPRKQDSGSRRIPLFLPLSKGNHIQINRLVREERNLEDHRFAL